MCGALFVKLEANPTFVVPTSEDMFSFLDSLLIMLFVLSNVNTSDTCLAKEIFQTLM